MQFWAFLLILHDFGHILCANFSDSKFCVRYFVSFFHLWQDPSLSSSSAVPLTPEGHLETSALERLGTGGRVVTAVRYRKPGATSSQWAGCRLEDGKVLPPGGGWGCGEDFVVFVEQTVRRTRTNHCNKRTSKSVPKSEESNSFVNLLKSNLAKERQSKNELICKVAELERTIAAMKDATEASSRKNT